MKALGPVIAIFHSLMKHLSSLLLFIFCIGLIGFQAHAKKRVKKMPQGVNLQTDIQFNASTLHGRYQTPAEAFAKVEDEKNLSDLLVPRTHFKDRMAFQVKGSQ